MKFLISLIALVTLNAVATEKVLFAPFHGEGYTCRDATQAALKLCYEGGEEIMPTIDAVEPGWCRKDSCSCSLDSRRNVSQSVCLGSVRIEDGSPKLVGEKDKHLFTQGSGVDCGQADHIARGKLYKQLEKVSKQLAIISIGRLHCPCEPGFPALVHCTNRVTYND